MAVITNLHIGRNGRLGNQLFQAASAIGLAHNLNAGCFFPRVWAAPSRIFQNGEYWLTLNDQVIEGLARNEYPGGENEPLINLVEGKGGHIKDIYPTFLATEHLTSPTQLINLHGYFQSEKYFKFDELYLRQRFRAKDHILDYINSKYRFLENEEFTSLHVRRGDYVFLKKTHPHNPHPPQTLRYYRRAIEELNAKKLMVFSDDIDWCKEIFKDYDCHFVEERPHSDAEKNQAGAKSTQESEANLEADFTEIQIMSRCANHIIANSSFSWWGAWLNPSPDKKVVAPLLWHSPAYANIQMRQPKTYLDDLLPPDWIRI